MTGRHSSAHLTLKCIEPDHCSVVFEPYGSEVILVAEDEIRLSFNCRDEPRIEVAYSPGCITVWLPADIDSVSARDRLDDVIDIGLPL
jgi:hypothetical protein